MFLPIYSVANGNINKNMKQHRHPSKPCNQYTIWCNIFMDNGTERQSMGTVTRL
jgi:hypothetical protein